MHFDVPCAVYSAVLLAYLCAKNNRSSTTDKRKPTPLLIVKHAHIKSVFCGSTSGPLINPPSWESAKGAHRQAHKLHGHQSPWAAVPGVGQLWLAKVSDAQLETQHSYAGLRQSTSLSGSVCNKPTATTVFIHQFFISLSALPTPLLKFVIPRKYRLPNGYRNIQSRTVLLMTSPVKLPETI